MFLSFPANVEKLSYCISEYNSTFFLYTFENLIFFRIHTLLKW